jgi:peptidyl-prolyl cis-trans isomerase SurA|tara:strand:+ start:582 stop:1844 length:1263 start_codon:yes stop_codon:yes gene_type:complete
MPIKSLILLSFYILQNFLLITEAFSRQTYIEVDTIVAIVEKESISKSQLINAIEKKTEYFIKNQIEIPKENILVKTTLSELINQSLIMQFSEQAGIQVSSEELQSIIKNIADRNQSSIDELKIKIESEGNNFSEFKEQIRLEVTINKLKQSQITSKLNVSDYEIDNYIALQEKMVSNSYNIHHILVKNSEELSEVIKSLKISSFQDVAKKYSSGPLAESGGDFGWRKIEEFPDSFVEIIKSLKVGQVSQNFKTNNGLHVIKLTDKKGIEYKTILIDQAKVRHILIKQNEISSEDSIKNKLNDIKDQILQGLNFTDAAKKFSEDASASNGGELGWISDGDTVPEFEKKVKELKINEISNPVKTNLGWHILEVLERRVKDMTIETKRAEVKDIIIRQKTESDFVDWLTGLKDRSHIEMRLYN